jgi:hydroxymethylbilane synthase
VHAAILAAAGLHRLGARQHITCYLDAPAWLPAAGQGAIAVQVRADDTRTRALADAMNDPSTMRAVRAERAFLAALEGGCQVPIGALALPSPAGGGVLHGMIADIRGSRVVRGAIDLDPNDPELSGIRLANQLRGEGASEILEGLRRAEHLPSPQPE